ncbi:MAG TPA: hypothetical protein EYN66_09085 [Myxococcales bacterium]|nr:hypothetical protein [Myxococcales bacterium]
MREWFNDLNGHGDAAPWIDTGMTVTGGFMLGFGLTTQTKSDTRGSQQIFEVLGSSMGKSTLILERRGHDIDSPIILDIRLCRALSLQRPSHIPLKHAKHCKFRER